MPRRGIRGRSAAGLTSVGRVEPGLWGFEWSNICCILAKGFQLAQGTAHSNQRARRGEEEAYSRSSGASTEQ